jgi:hypothetical protein
VFWLNPSITLNFKKPSMDFDSNKPGELRFIRNSSVFRKISTAVRQANQKPEPNGLWFSLSSGAKIRTWDLRVMSKDLESVPLVRPARSAWVCAAGHANPDAARQGKCQPNRRTLILACPARSSS